MARAIPAVAYAENFRGGGQVSSQSCDVTNQLQGKCRRHDHSRGVRGHTPGKFCKTTPKNTHFCAFWKQVLDNTVFTFFYFWGLRGWPWHSGLPPPYASAYLPCPRYTTVCPSPCKWLVHCSNRQHFCVTCQCRIVRKSTWFQWSPNQAVLLHLVTPTWEKKIVRLCRSWRL